MRIRTLVLFLAAVVLAGGTGMLVRSFLAQKTAEVEAQPLARAAAPQKSVLVARNGITRGQILKPQDFSWQVWPEGGIDRNYIQAGTRPAEAFAGWVARDPFVPGEPISEAKIVSPGARKKAEAASIGGVECPQQPLAECSGPDGRAGTRHVSARVTSATGLRGSAEASITRCPIYVPGASSRRV